MKIINDYKESGLLNIFGAFDLVIQPGRRIKMEDDATKILDLKYFRIWHTPSMFSLGLTIDTNSLMLNISIGTLQIIMGRCEGE